MAGHLAQGALDARHVEQRLLSGAAAGPPLGDLLAHEVVVIGDGHRPTARAAYANAQTEGS
jgi:hypothetical protein